MTRMPTGSGSDLERVLLGQLMAIGLPEPEREYRFHPTRRWRFDLAWPDPRLAVEVEGGTWSGGRHTTGAGFEADAEKYAEAVLAGWRVLRVTGKMIESGRAMALVERALRPIP
ncbi:MAG: hypothetical protein M0Z95_04400 [Actinomycetota bacterium]|nr:hypothetical protein [Actinomycetota bacterium]